MKVFIFSFLMFFYVSAVFAVQPQEMLEDAALEQRARILSKELRCPVCQGEDIDESNAPLASDLRRLVRQRLITGDSDAEVLSFLQKRYGDFILMNPPMQRTTLVLWCLPFFILLGGCSAVLIYLHKVKS